MKRSILLMMAVLAVSVFAGCSSDDDKPADGNHAADIAGTYNGYTKAEFKYSPTPMYTGSESLAISEGADGTATVVLTSSIWGRFEATGLAVTVNDGVYTMSGEGSVEMGMPGTEASSYEFTLAGTVKSKTDAIFTFNVRSVMDGLVVTFTTGALPMQYAVAGTYEGYVNAGSDHFSDRITADEKLTITSKEDGTADLSFESGEWGNYEIEDIEISAADGGYTISGEGKVSMGMPGGSEPSEYPFTMAGTIRSAKDATVTFTIPTVMGGLTVTFHTGDVPHTLAIQGKYTGYTKANSKHFTDMITAGATLEVTANNDGTADLNCTCSVWGEFSAKDITITEEDGVYTIGGQGTVMMAMQGGEPAAYAFEMEGAVVSAGNIQVTFTVPDVMGGTTIEFITGEAPEE